MCGIFDHFAIGEIDGSRLHVDLTCASVDRFGWARMHLRLCICSYDLPLKLHVGASQLAEHVSKDYIVRSGLTC